MKDVSTRNLARQQQMQEELASSLSETTLKLLKLSAEKGASSWLTSLPLKEYGFRLNKQEFADAVSMRYNLPLENVPKHCVCDADYGINHCLTCKNGGFIHFRHNIVRDTVGKLTSEICKDVRIEPALLPVTGEALPDGANTADGARADVSALSFWQPLSRAFFDIKVFNALATTNWRMEIPEMYAHHEKLKKKAYNDRIIEVEKGTFTPLVFSCSGGASAEASKFIKQLSAKLSEKRQEQYSATVNFVRRRIRFDILRSCIYSLRGERSRRGGAADENLTELEMGLHRLSAE